MFSHNVIREVTSYKNSLSKRNVHRGHDNRQSASTSRRLYKKENPLSCVTIHIPVIQPTIHQARTYYLYCQKSACPRSSG